MISACPYCGGTTGFSRSFLYSETQYFNFQGLYNDNIKTEFVRGGMTATCVDCKRPIEQLRKNK